VSTPRFYYWEVPQGGGGVVHRQAEQGRGQGTCPPGGNVTGGVFECLVGARKMDPICNAISLLLTGQITLLLVLPLPNNALGTLVGALGLRADCCEKMGHHEGAMVRRMLKHRRGRSQAARVGLPPRLSLSALGRMITRDNAFLAEKRSRVEEARRDPDGR
jgi:hypothetical protein